MDWFGNNAADGYVPRVHKYEPKWERTVDYSPDRRRSDGAMYIEDRGKDIIWVMQVRGLGALVFRATDSKTFEGVSTFTNDMIEFDDGMDKEFEQCRPKK